MSDLRELYQETILGHYKKPKNFQSLPDATRKQEGYNPLCGDKVTVFLKLENDLIQEVCFQGSGCAISTASASMMTEALKGKSRAQAEQLFKDFHELVAGSGLDPSKKNRLGKLAVFAGVREFPMRVKCATLAWHTLKAAMDGIEKQTVTTEE